MRDLQIRTHFLDQLPADPILENSPRQVEKTCYSLVNPKQPKDPKLIHLSDELLTCLGFDKEEDRQWLSKIVCGQTIYPNTKPYAMCYGGHQFGNWAGQLGDGRAINLFTIHHQDQDFTLQLKGAGPTPYSRTADGFAVLRSSIREHLCSEAMYHLGVPTSRSLSLSLTGDQVMRDVMYDGHPAYEPGAIVCRVAETFLRFGNYEIFAARGDKKTLQQLVNYTIQNHFSHIKLTGKDAVVELFKEIAERTIDLVFEWQRVGFVHGVMNTDNMSILGLTIDYGPYGWLENFDPLWTPNTTDKANRRYRYGWQPNIALWNLVKLANSFYYLIDESKPFEEILEMHQSQMQMRMQQMILQKLGIYKITESDKEFVDALVLILQEAEFDYTLFFRELSNQNHDVDDLIKKTSYISESFPEELKKRFSDWMNQYQTRIDKETLSQEERLEKMKQLNPKYVLRNYMAQLAIEQAEKGEYSLIDELYTMLKQPYFDQPQYDQWYVKRPDWAKNKIGSSMLSCSS